MATKSKQDDIDIVQVAVDGALADIKKYASQEFEELLSDPAKKETMVQAAREAAEEEVKLAGEFHAGPCDDVAARLLKYLPKDRVDLIETGLQIPTYSLDIQKTNEGQHRVDITRDEKPFMMESIKLDSGAALAKASSFQIASIVVESVLLVLRSVGIKVSISNQIIAKVVEYIIPVVEHSSQIQQAVHAIEKASKGVSKWDIAKAIYDLIKELYSTGILWKIIKHLLSNVSTWEWIKIAGIVSAKIIAAFGTDGAALIANFVLALNSANKLMKKLTNLQDLKALKEKTNI